MPQSHTAGRNATGRKAESGFSYTYEYSTIHTYTYMIQQNMNELGTNSKTLTVTVLTEHMMVRLVVHAWQMMVQSIDSLVISVFCS